MNPSSSDGNTAYRVSTAFIKRHRLVLAVLCILLVSGIAGAAWSSNELKSNRLLQGVSILNTPVGGKTPQEAQHLVEQVLRQKFSDEIQVRLNSKLLSLGTGTSLFEYNLAKTLDQAYRAGRNGPLLKRLFAPLIIRLSGYNLPIHTEVNRSILAQRVEQALGNDLKPAQNAELVIQASSTSSNVFIQPEIAGVTIDLEQLSRDLKNHIIHGSTEPINLVADTRPPTIKTSDLEPLVLEAERWLDKTPFTLQTEGKQWTINSTDLAPWISVNTTTSPLSLNLDKKMVATSLRNRAKDFLQPTHDGMIQVDTSSTVIAFEAPIQGIDVDTPKTIENILSGWQNGSSTIDLVLTRVNPRILGDGERLGIQEVIGVGRSNFSGSPSNRRKNIALGAKKVNTTLIEPGGEFSLLKTLGEIDGEHGWLPELVIKGNKTTPEFGGGLCQVGTTMFRAAMASGMPITERRNHSYRVRYYEPAGTDATIYEPAPDFKFKNDTTNWLLITTSIKGDEMAFTVWGKNDGRLAHQTTPRVYNIVAPPPKKIIETLDLPPGTEKCTESAHAGADAEFTYTVTYADSTVKQETFKSRYRPWQAVCLKGVSTLTQPTDPTVDQTGINNPNL